MPRTGFDPRAHGFHFANDFVDKVVTVPGYGEVATDGRSGGMAFAALDYWFAGLPVPSHRPEDFPDRAVPDDGTRLADFIHKRLFDSFATWSARQFLTWSLAEDHPTWSSPGVARMTRQELPRVRRSLDAGRPVVLGLVGARSIDEVGRNRQVVAYGYDDDGAGRVAGRRSGCSSTTPPPRRRVVLGFEPSARHWEASAGGGPWRGLFLQDYARERPPYIDLGAAKGIWVNSWTPTLGGNFVAQFTARNYGDYRAHLSELRLAVRGPAGENLDRFLGGDGDPTPLEPGEERAVFKASDGFGTVPGSYAIAAGYLSEQGCWLGIPPGEPGAVDEVGVTVIPAPHRSRVTVTFTGVTVEDADAVGGRLVLRLNVGDQAVRWPEGSPDVQDGKRFELDQRFDLVLNPSSVCRSRQRRGRRRFAGRAGFASPTSASTTGAPATTPTAAAPASRAQLPPPQRTRPPNARVPTPATAPGRSSSPSRSPPSTPEPGGVDNGPASLRSVGYRRPGSGGRPMMRRLVASAAEVGSATRAATTRRLRAGTTYRAAGRAGWRRERSPDPPGLGRGRTGRPGPRRRRCRRGRWRTGRPGRGRGPGRPGPWTRSRSVPRRARPGPR